MAATLHAKGDLDGAKEKYTKAMECAPKNTIEWATYTFHVALAHVIHGERQSALDLFQNALSVREGIEIDSQEIQQIRRTIEKIQNNAA